VDFPDDFLLDFLLACFVMIFFSPLLPSHQGRFVI